MKTLNTLNPKKAGAAPHVFGCPGRPKTMASALRQLKDEHLETIHHMIRRDAMTDLEIAQKAEQLLGKKMAKTNGAKAKIVQRYRKSAAYRAWEARRLNQEMELEKHMRATRAKYELISSLVQGDQADGFEGVSKSIQARLLTLATEATDEELKDAAGAKGWVATSLKLVREMLQDKWKKQVEELKSELKTMLEEPKGKKVNTADVVKRVDEIMGLA